MGASASPPRASLTNATEAKPVKDNETMTREQLDRSGIKNQIKRDDLQKQLLDPLFPERELKNEKPPAKDVKSL